VFEAAGYRDDSTLAFVDEGLSPAADAASRAREVRAGDS